MMYRERNGHKERDLFQEDIFCLVDKWKMEFNIDQKYQYHLNSEQLVTIQRGDLGVIINETLKSAEHFSRLVKEANQVLGII